MEYIVLLFVFYINIYKKNRYVKSNLKVKI